jgi:hypothetical protein
MTQGVETTPVNTLVDSTSTRLSTETITYSLSRLTSRRV